MRAPASTVLRPLFTVLLSVTLLAASPGSASACWDGYRAEVGRVEILRRDADAWSPARAREAARWGARIGAVLPPGAAVTVQWDTTTCEGGPCGTGLSLPVGADDLPGVFRAVTRALHVPKAKAARSAAIEHEVYTVQIFSGSPRGAHALATRVTAAEAGRHGFFEAGGFPARNPEAHVIPDPARGQHRVVVGAFLSRKAAAAALVALRAAGFRGYVRPLPG